MTTERQSAERELRSLRRTVSRLEESERQAGVDAGRAQEIARAAREEAKRARADAAAAQAAGRGEGAPAASADAAPAAGHELDALTERLIEVEARAEHLAEENERLRRALGQVREAMGVEEEDEDAGEPEPGRPPVASSTSSCCRTRSSRPPTPRSGARSWCSTRC